MRTIFSIFVLLNSAATACAGSIQTRDGKLLHGEIRFMDSGAITIQKDGQTTTIAPANMSQMLLHDAPQQSTNGLLGEYFQTTEFSEPRGKRVDAKIDFNWPANTQVIQGISNDAYSIRWTGQILPRFSQQYTFSTINDDDVRLWINNQQVLESWTGSNGSTSGKIALEAGRRYDIKIDFVNRRSTGGLQFFWTCPGQAQEIVPTECLFTNAGVAEEGVGLRGQYYSGSEFSKLKLTRIDPTIYFNWGGSPDVTLAARKSFSVRWSGLIKPRYTGSYTFYTHCTGGVHLWVNGSEIIDDWNRKATSDHTGVVQLTANTKADIKMEYCYALAGAATVELQWSSDKQGREYIPKSRLYPDASTAIQPVSEFDVEPPAAPQGTILTDGTVIQALPDKIDPHAMVDLHWHDKNLSLSAHRIAAVFHDGAVASPNYHWPAERGALQRNGEFIDGNIVEFKDGHLTVSSILFGNRWLGFNDTRAVLFQKPDPATASFTVRCNDGSVYAANTIQYKNNTITVDTDALGSLTLNPADVYSIKAEK